MFEYSQKYMTSSSSVNRPCGRYMRAAYININYIHKKQWFGQRYVIHSLRRWVTK